jgi:hypothetical protein
MSAIKRLSTLSDDPQAFAAYLTDLEATNPKGFETVDAFLERCVGLDADPEKTAKHLASNPNGELAFFLSEDLDKQAGDFLYSAGLEKRDIEVDI